MRWVRVFILFSIEIVVRFGRGHISRWIAWRYLTPGRQKRNYPQSDPPEGTGWPWGIIRRDKEAVRPIGNTTWSIHTYVRFFVNLTTLLAPRVMYVGWLSFILHLVVCLGSRGGYAVSHFLAVNTHRMMV